MRIALLIYSLEGGGAERVMSLLASKWGQLGHNIKLFSLDDGRKDHYSVDSLVDREFLNIAGISPTLFHGIKNNLCRVHIVRKRLKAFRPDIVLSFIDSSNILNILASLGTRWITVVSERTVPEKRAISARWRLARKLFYPLASGIVVQTKQIQKFYNFCRKSKIEIIENPVSQFLIEKKSRSLASDDEGVVLAVGRLELVKGFDLLIEAFKLIADKTKWNLRIVGSGSRRDQLLAQIRSLSLESRIQLVPRILNILDEYKNADLFVMSSRVEGFPNVLAEAMSTGLPVVAFDCPYGPGALIESGKNGFLAENENINDLSQKILSLISQKDLRLEFGENAINIKQRLDLEIISKKWINFFEKLIREHEEENKLDIA